LEADQHNLQSLKSVFLSRNLDQNMPKNALKKAAKIIQHYSKCSFAFSEFT